MTEWRTVQEAEELRDGRPVLLWREGYEVQAGEWDSACAWFTSDNVGPGTFQGYPQPTHVRDMPDPPERTDR